jgi:hypothetical protein
VILRRAARPVLAAVQGRIDAAVRAAEERQERRLHEVASRLVAEKDAESAEQHRMRELVAGEIGARIDELDDQLRRISAQLVALESRVADLERPAVELVAGPAERAEARGLLDEVRAEHRRTRAELAAIAFYEERIARLESTAG